MMRAATILLAPFLGSAAPTNFHYQKTGSEANYDEKTNPADGVTLFKWKGTEAGVQDMSADVCAHNIIEWEAQSVTPYPPSDAVHAYDTVYFVAQGNLTITVGSTTKTMKAGDTVWIEAGVSHSSLVPSDNDAGAIVTALKVPFEPQLTDAPTDAASTQFRFYMASEELQYPTHFRGPNDHYEWYGKGSDPDVLHVWWPADTLMNCHSHPEGALYVTAWGSMCFAGETISGNDCRISGEARWTNPSYQYSNEASGDDGAEIIVMNIHSGPQMCHAHEHGIAFV
jgi:mannose-6-phosphate isomerase-like protein (cupin superfamily)